MSIAVSTGRLFAAAELVLDQGFYWMNRTFAVAFALCFAVMSWLSAGETTILRDEFDTLPPGPLSKVLWARAEYHFLPEAGPKGPWNITAYTSVLGSQRAWQVIDHGGHQVLQQTYTPQSEKHIHPMVTAGDPLWQNYQVNVKFTPKSNQRQSGVVFRLRNDRNYYFFGVAGEQAVLKYVQDELEFRKPFEKVLIQKEFAWKPGEELTATVLVNGPHITARLNETLIADLEDSTFTEGRIGLTADIPTVFSSVTVTVTEEEKQKLDARIRERSDTESKLQAANPAMKVWKKASLGEFGVGRNVRFGDLNGDGQMDALIGQMVHHGPKDKFSELSCLTAITFDGEVLWQIGEADPWKDHLTNDVAFQIHDLDGDGKQEVVYTMNQQLVVAEGATGKTKQQVATPQSISSPKNPQKYPRILGDSLFFANLRDRGRADHLLLKDRYTNFWVIDSKLETQWHGACTTGHYPYAKDVDGDGRDELFVGYSMYNPDGTQRWSLDSQIKDHADAVIACDLHPENPGEIRVLCAASDEGFFITDLQGKILKRHRVGHAQNLTVANFRDDLPGLEILVFNYWGNQGIAHFYNAEGELYHDFEPANHGSTCLPVNWTGKKEEFWCLSPHPVLGGLYDGHGRCVLKFPKDGHPDMCFMPLDVTGDCRDELIVWDPYEMWVYTQADSPLPGPLYQPTRNPLYTHSNYGASGSFPPSKK